MASYQYWMVYLPDVSRSSFLLYTRRGGGWMALRDYSQGFETQLLAPLRGKLLQDTEYGVTRFPVEPLTVEDLDYWIRMTSEYNQAKLADAIAAVDFEGT
jgi:hypothetical protein